MNRQGKKSIPFCWIKKHRVKKFAYVWVEEPRRPYTKILMGGFILEIGMSWER